MESFVHLWNFILFYFSVKRWSEMCASCGWWWLWICRSKSQWYILQRNCQRIIMMNSNYRDMVKGRRRVQIRNWAWIFLWQRLSSPHSTLRPMKTTISKSISVNWNNNKKRYFLVNLMILLLIIWILWATYMLKYFF